MPTYIIRAGDIGPVKIGWADDVPSRLRSLQTGNHETLHVLREVDTWWQSEREFHRRFTSHRLRGEWFTFHPEMLTFIPTVPRSRTRRDSTATGAGVSRDEAKMLISRLLDRRHPSVPVASALTEIAIAADFTMRRVKAIHHMEARLIADHEIKALRRLCDEAEERRPASYPGAAGGSVS